MEKGEWDKMAKMTNKITLIDHRRFRDQSRLSDVRERNQTSRQKVIISYFRLCDFLIEECL